MRNCLKNPLYVGALSNERRVRRIALDLSMRVTRGPRAHPLAARILTGRGSGVPQAAALFLSTAPKHCQSVPQYRRLKTALLQCDYRVVAEVKSLPRRASVLGIETCESFVSLRTELIRYRFNLGDITADRFQLFFDAAQIGPLLVAPVTEQGAHVAQHDVRCFHLLG